MTRTHTLPPSMAVARPEGEGHVLHAPVLVLNASYEPINVCAARRAIVLVLKGVAMTEEENGHFLHAARLGFAHPRTGATIELRAPLAPELIDYLSELARAIDFEPSRVDAALRGYL